MLTVYGPTLYKQPYNMQTCYLLGGCSRCTRYIVPSQCIEVASQTAKDILPRLTSNRQLISLLSSMWIDTGARPDQASFMMVCIDDACMHVAILLICIIIVDNICCMYICMCICMYVCRYVYM